MTRKRRALRIALALLGAFVASLILLRWIDPWTTAVHAQRRVESWFGNANYQKRYEFVPLKRISPHLQHAVVAAEDGKFFHHHGFDWTELKDAVTDDWEEGRFRGASTISQQLVKNLYLTTHGGVARKGAEFVLVPFAEAILSKQRMLELYLNVIEMGPGVYGAEAAARYHFGVSAARLNREQAARLAAILPSPRRRRPQAMHQYGAVILERMSQMGW
jgi:monofunctional biosynthetic peptidoglycan transglycosylase